MVKKTIAKKSAKEVAKKVTPKPKPKTRVTKPKTSTASKAKPVQPNKVNPGLAGTAAAGATVGTGLAISARKNKGESFDDAFRKARAKGEGTLFTHNGKKYTAVTKDDLKKKGYATDTAGLAAYNRAGGKKKQEPLSKEDAKSIVDKVNKNRSPRKRKRQARRKERIGFETFKQRRQARRAARKMKSGGVVSAKRSTPRGVGAAKRGFGRALKG
tara:strand:- start:720 stop:1361 length:642 start_codon:yes stop_codon:yes gene_type:complete